MAANDEDLLELKYDSASRRRSRIAAMIADHGFCTITELATAFDVSDMTVRRDILKLTQSDRTLRIVHGGIRAVPLWQFEGTDYRTRAMHNRLVKERIAAEAVKLMVPGSTIALDSGTTGIAIAEAIPADFRLNVVTQSLPAANALASKEELEVSVPGGTLIRSMQAFVGPGAIAAIAGLRINTFFLSATSIDERGVLVMSEFAGASEELKHGAILVNPNDVAGTAKALREAALMPPEEKSTRMRLLRNIVKQNDVHRWAQSFLEAAGEVSAKSGNGNDNGTANLELIPGGRSQKQVPGLALVAAPGTFGLHPSITHAPSSHRKRTAASR